MALMSIVVGAVGDRLGRRRFYALLFGGLAASGLVFAVTTQLWALCLAALTGTLSTGVSESGPFTSLEQSMLPVGLDRRATTRIFGTYNAVAAIAGSVGALAAGGPEALRRFLPAIPTIIGCSSPSSRSDWSDACWHSPSRAGWRWRRPSEPPPPR